MAEPLVDFRFIKENKDSEPLLQYRWRPIVFVNYYPTGVGQWQDWIDVPTVIMNQTNADIV